MKNVSMLAWLSQLGLSVAVPPVISIMLAVWIRNRYDMGIWVVWIGIALGIYCSVAGLISSLRLMEQLSHKKKQDLPPAFNEHE